MKTLILLLGAPNDDHGNLSKMGEYRAKKVLELLKKYPDAHILPTGGFGWNFNRTEQPHWQHIRTYLLNHGVPRERILDGVESKNTIGDFQLVKPIVEREHPEMLIVVSSDFHMPRVKLIAKQILGDLKNVQFEKAKSPLLTKLIHWPHEKMRITQIKSSKK